jgi:putative FmdB family regulatory protein
MPIYAYRCEQCGFQKDVLQKMSDPLLVTCPSCGEPAFRKQVTAAGFQLKGSGWYVTDFRNPPAGKEGAKNAKGEGGAADGDKKSDAPPAEAKGAGDAASAGTAAGPAPASGTSAAGPGGATKTPAPPPAGST